jgi:CheY-like chemotaxis protein
MAAMTVLVVNSDPLVREATAGVLNSEGYAVLEAGSADEALRVLADGAHLDLIVSDVRMPQKDGFTLAVEVRQTHPQLPFVFITGYMLSPERDAALGRVLWEPFKTAELIAAVEQALRGAERYGAIKLEAT